MKCRHTPFDALVGKLSQQADRSGAALCRDSAVSELSRSSGSWRATVPSRAIRIPTSNNGCVVLGKIDYDEFDTAPDSLFLPKTRSKRAGQAVLACNLNYARTMVERRLCG